MMTPISKPVVTFPYQVDRSYIISHNNHPPLLAIVIDTEEEFDWSLPFDRAQTAVSHMQSIGRAQRILQSFGVVPTYVVDFAVASQDAGIGPLREYAEEGQAEIGAHLHPWVNPPFEEPVDAFHSYPGNLPRKLEYEKLKQLRDRIWEVTELRPRVYRAGRYGLGPYSFESLINLGFEVDTSPAPAFDLRGDGGPDYSKYPIHPFWDGLGRNLLCVPVTGAFVGPLPDSWKIRLLGHIVDANLARRQAMKVCNWLHLAQRIRLSPEGHTLKEMKALSRHIVDRGVPLLVLTFHSPTVMPGGTPYADTISERDAFLHRLEAFLDYAVSELNAIPTTLSDYRASQLAESNMDAGHRC